MSLERTLMSWVRTAISLIGFGFTIVQFFERVPGHGGRCAAPAPAGAATVRARAHSLRHRRPRDLRLAIQNVASLPSGAPFTPLAGVEGEVHKTPILAVSMLLLLIGLATFFSLLMRMA